MITIPLYVILIIYIVYVGIVAVFTYVNISHLFHNGAFTIISFLVTLLIFALTATTLYFTFVLFSQIDWKQPLTLWNNDWITNTLNPANF